MLKNPKPAIGRPTGIGRLRPGARRSLALLVLWTAALVAAGCGNNPYDRGLTRQPILFRYLVGDLRTLDPTKSYVVDEALVVDSIYQSYFQYHPFKQNPYVLQLALGAEEPRREKVMVMVDQGGRRQMREGEKWTFVLKPDLKFQDDPCFPGGQGRQVLASDIIFSFKRMADPSIGSPVLSFFEDKVLGLAEYVAESRKRLAADQQQDYAAEVEGLQFDPVDPLRFSIVLNQPYPQLRYLMAMHFTAPIPREAVETYGEELARHPVGCGQYVLEEYIPKRRVVLAVNPNRPRLFYPSDGDPGDAEAGLLKDAGKQLPLNEKVVFTFISERITSWNFFLQGYLDRYGVTQDNLSQVLASSGELTPEMKQKGVKLEKSATANVYYFSFNMTDPIVGGYTEKKRKLRQAISLAIDSQEFIDVLFDGNGSPAEWLIPPGIEGYDPNFKNPYKRADLVRARKLLSEAGYPGGIDPRTDEKFTLYYDSSATTPEGRQLVGLVERQIERIGINVEVRISRDVIWQDRVDEGKFQFVNYGWFADYPDPENFVFLLYGPNKRPGPNHTSYQNPEYDRIFEQMRSMEESPERQALIRRLRDIAVEDAPWIPLHHDQALGLTYDWVQNNKPHGVANDVMKYWTVDGEKRARKQQEWNQMNFWPVWLLLVALIVAVVPAWNVVRARHRRRVRESEG